MAAINLRVPNGLTPLTNQQVDDNFQNLNNALGAAGSATIPTPSGTGVPLLTISPTTTGTFTAQNITYSGGITGGTSVIAIGTNQIYKDVSGNVGLGNTPSGTYKLEVTGGVSATGFTGTIGATTATTGKFTSLEYTTTLTGGTGIIAIGTNQIYKDVSGNVGLGNTPSGTYKLEVTGGISYTTTLTGGTGIIAIGTNQIYKDASGNVGLGGTPTVKFEVISTGAMLIPKGLTANRPTGVAGYIRYNTTTLLYEGHNGTTWSPFVVNTTGTADDAGTAIAMAIALG
jgi:ribosomal protein S6E (S10)